MIRTSIGTIYGVLVALLLSSSVSAEPKQSTITKVTLNPTSFNPSQDKPIELSYTLTKAEVVTVQVYDPDGGLVRTLVKEQAQDAGTHQITWDGQDEEQRVVPNEAYTLTIETTSGSIYDPTTFSGGVVSDIKTARFNPGGSVVYQLPAAARVLIRLGIHNGPLLKTLVDWTPRVAGSITEHWDGKDQDKLIDFHQHQQFSGLITYVTLPETTVITYGNTKESYRDYKLNRAQNRPQKPHRPRIADPQMRFRPTSLVPPTWARAPQVLMTFPQTPDTSVPEVATAIETRIDVDPSDRATLLDDQFEIAFFVDNVFFAEAERGYLPLNWHWDLTQLTAGEHILTVNISSFKGQVGVASRKIKLIKTKEK